MLEADNTKNIDSVISRGVIEIFQRAVAEHWLLAFDFDGTLAPFTSRPADSVIPISLLDPFARLTMGRMVAIISGRSIDDLRSKIHFKAILIGNHGGEGFADNESMELSATNCVLEWLSSIGNDFSSNGCWVEDKGLSLSLHWRCASDPTAAEAVARELAARLFPHPHLIPGEMVLNCLPVNLYNKGSALRRLLDLHRIKKALFIGDDWTDATVFRCRDPRITGIQVGDKDLGAFWRIPDQASVGLLLHTMSDSLPPTSTDRSRLDTADGSHP